MAQPEREQDTTRVKLRERMYEGEEGAKRPKRTCVQKCRKDLL